MDPAYLINEIKKIHPQQYTLPLSIFMAIRAKIEHRAGFINRIGRVYPDGNRHVLIIGKAGTGKTRTLKNIYNGLDLGSVNACGRRVGHWIPSAGASTGIGIYETLSLYNDSIIFIDEMSIDSKLHMHILKQIGNGEIMRLKHREIDPVPFTGLVVSATNAINVPKNQSNMLEHFLAVLDRFIIVKTQEKLDINKDIDLIINDNNVNECDWPCISRAITRKVSFDLNQDEIKLLKEIWNNKTKEIIDTTRPQKRNAWLVFDIFLFIKRLFGINDISRNNLVISIINDMVNDCVIFNPVNILWLSPLEQIIYDEVKAKNTLSFKEILDLCEKSGQFTNIRNIQKLVNNMVISRIMIRNINDTYSVKFVEKGEVVNKNHDQLCVINSL